MSSKPSCSVPLYLLIECVNERKNIGISFGNLKIKKKKNAFIFNYFLVQFKVKLVLYSRNVR